jgi:HEAT repeat protein
LQSANPDECIAGLREVAQRAREADVGRVAEVASRPDATVAAEAVRSLGAIDRPQAVQALAKVAADDRRSSIRGEAVLQLGRRREDDVLVVLRSVIVHDPAPQVRGAAAISIARLRSYKDVPLLIEVAEKDDDLDVQGRAVGAVESLIGLKFGYNGRGTPEERAEALARMRNVAPKAAALLERSRGSKVKP